MSADLTTLLRDWPFEPGKVNVRVIVGEDGEPKIQLRIDLGLMQMAIGGRPDGKRPEGHDSVLEMHESRLDDILREDGSKGAFVLAEADCKAIREEVIQYHHRTVCLMVLEDFDGVVRDTLRNERALELCAKHAETESDRHALEHLRPYVTMMRARALASQAVRDNESKVAMLAIDEGLEALRQYFDETDQLEMFEDSNEVRMLRGLRASMTPKLPVSQSAELRQRLRVALGQENYELAAILRDELRLVE